MNPNLISLETNVRWKLLGGWGEVVLGGATWLGSGLVDVCARTVASMTKHSCSFQGSRCLLLLDRGRVVPT